MIPLYVPTVNHVYTGGTFDLLHPGHLELLHACRTLAGKDGHVTVGLNTDEFVQKYKGKRPVMDYRARKQLLETNEFVDHVVMNISGEDSKPTILRAGEGSTPKVNIVAIGSDWAGRDYYAQMGFTKEWLDKERVVLVYVDRRTEYSTTDIKKRVADLL